MSNLYDALENEVHRRTGGLEIRAFSAVILNFVHRRTGGLEKIGRKY